MHSGDWEYPLLAGVAPRAGLKPFATLYPPSIGPSRPRRRSLGADADAAGRAVVAMAEAVTAQVAAAPVPRLGMRRAGARRSACWRSPWRVALLDDPAAGGRGRAGAVGRLAPAGDLLLRPLVGTLLVHTVLLTVAATAGCVVIGTAVAWLRGAHRPARTARLGGARRAADHRAAFVTSFSWVSLTPAVQGFAGATLIVTLAYYPLVYLPVAAVLRGMDPALEESARSLGLGPWRTFLRVTLPQARPALYGGALIVAVHLLTEFGAFAMLRFQTFTTAIYDEYQLSFDGPAGSMLATVLVLLCVLVLVFELRLRGRARYARIGAGAARPLIRHRLGRLAPAVLLAFAALIGAALGLPFVTLGYWLLRGSSTAFPLSSLLDAAGASLKLGARRRAADHRAGAAGGDPGRAPPGPDRHAAGAQHLPGLRAAGHRDRAGADRRLAYTSCTPCIRRRCCCWSPTPCCSCRWRWSRCARRWPNRRPRSSRSPGRSAPGPAPCCGA